MGKDRKQGWVSTVELRDGGRTVPMQREKKKKETNERYANMIMQDI